MVADSPIEMKASSMRPLTAIRCILAQKFMATDCPATCQTVLLVASETYGEAHSTSGRVKAQISRDSRC